MQENAGGVQRGAPEGMDRETLEFAQQVFELVRSGYADRLKPLLERGLPANLRNQRGDSLLMLASYHGHFDVAKALLRHGGDTELRNDMGQTPIAGAAYKGDVPMVQLLLAHGANVEGAAPDGKTALMMAAMFNRTEVVKLLLAHGADASAQDAKGMTALTAARAMGAPDTSALLEDLSLQAGGVAPPVENHPAREYSLAKIAGQTMS
ncbi:ankyrin repeat domain-containing protein [Noviherbaspirillum aerium]|uniref:ankyrin repeat domain-containing protein n=1 Tax=Noviherbaspirillum aerium TaxID=2588497 RepID=UPI00124DE48F|nr:ankyrin repeat domain-containing protein [Noviherbaspirillum aerium]